MARGLKLCIWEVKELYYPYRENKDADQLRGDCEADLRFFVFAYAKRRFSQDEAHMTSLLFSG